MARLPGPNLSQQGFFARNFVRFIYWMTRCKLGKVVAPVQVMAYHPRLLQGYVMMERTQMKSHLVDPTIKELAQLRVATLIGCPF